MINIFAIGTSLLFVLTTVTGLAQKVTVLGSSTAEGTGASSPDSSWVGRLSASFSKNSLDGKDTIVNNRAKGGYVTYNSLPTGYLHPADRPDPDVDRNITYVLNDFPRADVVIINYPTNDIAYGYDPKEMMDNLRLMFKELTQNNIRCYITTTQPRDLSDNQRVILRQLVDSIQLNFGTYAINFWDDLATPDGHIKSEVSANDGIHVNDLGHRLLFQRVQAKNILSGISQAPLPITIKSWEAVLEYNSVKLRWTITHDELNASFEIERSKDGRNFQTIYQRGSLDNNADYSWTDVSPFSGNNFYRLKINQSGKAGYSRIIPIINDKKQLVTSFYTDHSQLYLQLNSDKRQAAALTVINYSGAIVKKQNVQLNGSRNAIKIPVSELPSGNYFLRILLPDGSAAIERFVR